ncbi:OLC1v1001456C1 [Oldenlandia corymbosa var. corymbosa]|uniref:OLC1v1001456C1 n=1 Tax=Oldenlandia corymbosa var. corymbosa TaxID=529605 RepID=A0AAV1D5A2_OLDCO|nr:OLC1v1001456C1 [Oldenlandia corymbosa var. corymbosa]
MDSNHGGNRTTTYDSLNQSPDCKAAGLKVAMIAAYMLGFFFVVFLCNFLHILLRPVSQPRFISEAIVGLSLSNLPIIRRQITAEVEQYITFVVDFGMIFHLFVLGLEIDPYIFLRVPFREAKVAYSGVLTTFVFASLLSPFLKISKVSNYTFSLCFSIILCGTASPLLTRLITDLKIGKSDIGRFVVTAGIHSDLITTLLICVGYVIFDPFASFRIREAKPILLMVSTLVIQMVIAAKLTPLFMNWVNLENPEGKPMKGSHLVLSVAFIVLVCSFSPLVGQYNKVLSAFLAGLFMPRDGRISKLIIGKVNYFTTTIFNPLLFCWVGTQASFSKFEAGHVYTWARLFFSFFITVAGKVLGSLVSGIVLGFHWPESMAIGLLLNIKGRFHIYLALTAAQMTITTFSTSIAMVFTTLLTVIYTPLIVAKIIERARKRSPTKQMALQWLHPTNEFRILLCLRGSQNVTSAINFMEISRGPPDPGVMVYLTDMVELTDKVAATLKQGEGADALIVTDPEIVEMRDQITQTVDAYLSDLKDGIQQKRMLALSTINSMHQDLCILAEDLMVSLVVLPFHKQQEADGKLNGGHSGFRHVNRKVLRHAPCSVGILVDRGLGITMITRSTVSLNAAVIFIGGKDDREALAYAGRVARHSGVKLTVIRFLLEVSGDSVSSRITIAKANSTAHVEEMKVDDECFAEFYDRHVAGGRVAYMEKYLVNSGQTFSTLRSLEGQYGLFIVGRGGRVNSVLTVGMNDWEECPELGPIGDILSASDFSVTASVLVIQQHNLRGELDGLQDEFSIM